MEYAKLGNTDIEVSKLCVGCMSFGKAGTLHDWTLDEDRNRENRKTCLRPWALTFLTPPTAIRKVPARNT